MPGTVEGIGSVCPLESPSVPSEVPAGGRLCAPQPSVGGRFRLRSGPAALGLLHQSGGRRLLGTGPLVSLSLVSLGGGAPWQQLAMLEIQWELVFRVPKWLLWRAELLVIRAMDYSLGEKNKSQKKLRLKYEVEETDLSTFCLE